MAARKKTARKKKPAVKTTELPAAQDFSHMDGDTLPVPTDPLPDLPEEAEEAWKKIEASRLGDRTKRALRWWLGGYTWSETAEIEGVSSSALYRRTAQRYGLYDALGKTPHVMRQSRRIALKAGAELERRLDDPEIAAQMADKDLASIRQTEIDKIGKHEGWGNTGAKEDGMDYVGALTALAEKIENGETVQLKLEVTKRQEGDAADNAVDITPPKVAE